MAAEQLVFKFANRKSESLCLMALAEENIGPIATECVKRYLHHLRALQVRWRKRAHPEGATGPDPSSSSTEPLRPRRVRRRAVAATAP